VANELSRATPKDCSFVVDLFTGGMILPLMFVNAAACYLLPFAAPLAFMEAWKKALESTDGTGT
jgi:hypothetical protein